MTHHMSVPDFVPTLSPGRHRNPRKGACFMEMASYLAGERWSDHPHCTHHLLAAMAREINDRLGDGARQELTPLIPSVVGLDGDDPRIDAWIAREAALTGLPIVAMSRQRGLAVGILRCEAALAELDGMHPDRLSPRARHTLAQVPEAQRWAREFIATMGSRRDAFLTRGTPAVVHQAVLGISEACVADPEVVLVGMLRRTIETMRQLLGTDEREEASRQNSPLVTPVTARAGWQEPSETSVRWDTATV